MNCQHTAITILVFALAIARTTDSSIADEPQLTATVSINTVRVAETFTLDISVHAFQGTRVRFPDGQAKLGPFDVRDARDMFDIPVEGDSNSRTWTRSLTLDTIETGDLQIPPISVQVQPPTGDGRYAQSADQELTTHPILVQVASMLEDRSDPTKFRDIDSVVDVAVPKASRSALPWAVGGVGLMAIALFAGVAVYRRRQWTTPLKWAIEQLNLIDPSLQEVTPELSRILRQFLMIQFDVAETGCTPREIVNCLRATEKIGTSTSERLICLLEIADEAMFAGLCLSPEGSIKAIQEARLLMIQIADETSTAGR